MRISDWSSDVCSSDLDSALGLPCPRIHRSSVPPLTPMAWQSCLRDRSVCGQVLRHKACFNRMRNTLGTLSFGAVAMMSSMRHVWGAREDGKMKDRNGFTDDNAREPRQRLSERDMAMFLRRMANDAISHANGLGSIARMLERNCRPVRLDEAARGVIARA